ncbi:MAG: trimethylamine methyltransferase family protein [Sedimentisphaerales bacterium]|nr:trimethylamine methyltransferase family protein [Sedimentisphaerales bacterium]
MKLDVLSELDVLKIHKSTLRVLEKTGVKVHSAQAKQLLSEAGCRVGQADLVKIPPELVQQSLETVSKGFTLYNRQGEVVGSISGRNCYFGTGVTNPNFHDWQTDQRRPTKVSDIAAAAKIADYLPNIEWIMPLGSVQDVPSQVSDIYEFEAAVSNTTKPIVFICHDVRGVSDVLAMAEAIAGGKEKLIQKPFVISYPEPISPLVHTKEAVEKLLFSAEYGIPIIYTPCPMAGATAPVTMAGLLVQTNAECLSGLVMSQLKRKGVPFVIGGVLTIMDMQTGSISYGAPELSLLLAGYADVARYYSLPTWGTAGCSDAKVPDVQAAVEATFSSLINCMAGLNLVHDPGFLEGAMIGSLEMLVITNEVVGMARRFMEGIAVNEEMLAEDVINAVGPGGNYLTEDHTLRHFRQQLWQPTLMDRRNYSTWKDNGAKTMQKRIKEKIRDILADHKPEPLPDDIKARIKEIREKSETERVK